MRLGLLLLAAAPACYAQCDDFTTVNEKCDSSADQPGLQVRH